MKYLILGILIMQIFLLGIGCWQVTKPEFLFFGLFNIIINSLFIPLNIYNFINC